jgi:hypothetical protein
VKCLNWEISGSRGLKVRRMIALELVTGISENMLKIIGYRDSI